MQALGRAGASTDSDDGLLREMRAVSAAVGAAPVVAQRAVISGLHCLRCVWPSAAGGPIAAASGGATALAGDDASWASWAAHMHHTAYAHAMSSIASEEVRGVVQRFECELSAHASFASWRDFLHVLVLVASGSADVPFSQHVCGTECCEQRTGALTFWHCLSAVLGAPTGGVSALRSALVHAAFLAPIAFIGGAASFMRTTTYAVVCDAVVRVAALRDCKPLDSSSTPRTSMRSSALPSSRELARCSILGAACSPWVRARLCRRCWLSVATTLAVQSCAARGVRRGLARRRAYTSRCYRATRASCTTTLTTACAGRSQWGPLQRALRGRSSLRAHSVRCSSSRAPRPLHAWPHVRSLPPVCVLRWSCRLRRQRLLLLQYLTVRLTWRSARLATVLTRMPHRRTVCSALLWSCN